MSQMGRNYFQYSKENYSYSYEDRNIETEESENRT